MDRRSIHILPTNVFPNTYLVTDDEWNIINNNENDSMSSQMKEYVLHRQQAIIDYVDNEKKSIMEDLFFFADANELIDIGDLILNNASKNKNPKILGFIPNDFDLNKSINYFYNNIITQYKPEKFNVSLELEEDIGE